MSEPELVRLSCLRCGDWNTALYCLNCAGELLRAENQRLRAALEFYSDSKKWTQCEAMTDVDWASGVKIQCGEPFMAFSDGEDHPWTVARNAMEDKP